MQTHLLVLLFTAMIVIVPIIVAIYALMDSIVIRDEGSHLGTTLVNLYGLIMLLLVGFAFAMIDGEFASSLSFGWLIMFLPYASLFALLLAYRRPVRFKAAAIVLVFAFVLAIRPIDWGTYKPFLRHLDRIQTGMTIEQVDTIMAGFEAAPAARIGLGSRLTTICSQSDAASLVAECDRYYAPQPKLDRAIITFREGRVIRVYYDND